MNIVFFQSDKSYSVHVDNMKKDILVLGEGLANRLNDTTISAEAKYFLITEY